MDDAAENARRELQDSIDLLYRTFGCYPLRPQMDACPCCVSDADRQRLCGAPLRELRPNDLDRYAFKAITTWGDVNDFRHFLPRLFELQASEAPIPVNDEVLFGKLSYAQWHTWPQAEQVAIENFLTAWGKALLTVFPSNPPLPEFLCVASEALGDVTPFLEHWWTATENSVPALRHLAEAVACNACSEQIKTWLNDPAKEDRLIERALQYERGELYEELAAAADWLSAMRPVSINSGNLGARDQQQDTA